MHNVFIFQLRYTDILLSKSVGLNNYFETRSMSQESSISLWMKLFNNHICLQANTMNKRFPDTASPAPPPPLFLAPLKLHFNIIVNLGFSGMCIIFLISALNIDDNGYVLEPPRRCAMIKNWYKDSHKGSRIYKEN